MKYFWLMSSILLFSFAANAEFVRKERRPAFFVPESVYNQQTSLGPVMYKKAEKVHDVHVDTMKKEAPSTVITEKAETSGNVIKEKAEAPSTVIKEKAETPKISFIESKISNTAKKKNTKKMGKPEYKKIYDKYHKNLLKYKSTKHLPKDPDLEKDLAKMNSDEVFEVED